MEKKELIQLNVKDLKAYAKKIDIVVPSGILKADLVKLLVNANKKNTGRSSTVPRITPTACISQDLPTSRRPKQSKTTLNEKQVKFANPLEQPPKVSKNSVRGVTQTPVGICGAKKIGKYNVIKQLGTKGKEGTTFLVENKKGGQFAMKVFSKTKAVSTLVKEAHYQKMVSKHGIAPKVLETNEEEKYILMELMDKNLFDIIKKNNGELSDAVQKKIVKVITKMDETGVFHGDPNPANFMLTGNQMYMIDYGFAKDIDEKLMKKHNTKTPNRKFMILGFLLKLKEIYREHNPNIEYNVLSKMLEN